MNFCNCLLLSGVLALFLAVPAVEASSSDELTPIKERLADKEPARSQNMPHKQVSPEGSQLTNQNHYLENTQISSLEQLSPEAKVFSTQEKRLVPLTAPATVVVPVQTPTVAEQSSLDTLNQLGNEQSEDNSADGIVEQVTSVSQLSDVQPTDWAFTALQNLVERYKCIAGYPDGSFRGNRAMTRYEFAAGLNACLETIVQLIGNIDPSNLATKEDLATLNRLLEEFQGELATLRNRTDALEARTAELEANQFSTTTNLTGEVVFAASDILGDINTGSGSVPHFSERVRLNFNTSFTGQDHLLVRLQAANTPNLSTVAGTNMARLHPDRNNGNTFDIDLGWYNFPIGEKANVLIEFAGGKLDDFAPSLNALDFGGAAKGSISQFGQRNPIYRLSGPGVGGGITYNFSKAIGLSLGYLAGNYLSGSDPTPGRGFFNGSFGAIAQLTVRPNDNISLGLTYVRSYFSEEDVADNNITAGGGVGSALAEKPFGDSAISANSWGTQASVRISPKFILGGWAGWTEATARGNGFDGIFRIANDGDKATIFNWAVTLAFPDLGKEGNLGGFIVGMPPKVTDNDVSDRQDSNTSLHLEAFYRWQITDNIGITPGLLVITNPEHNNNNDTIFVGTLRTTFSF